MSVQRESWHNHDILEELVILNFWNKLLWVRHENNYSSLGLSLTDKLSYCIIHSQPFETELLRSPRQSPAQSRVFPTVYFCDISHIKYFPWWGFHHLPQKAVAQIDLSSGRGTFVVTLCCPFLIESLYFHAAPTFNTLVSSLQSFMSHSSDSHLPLLETSALVCHTYLSVWLLQLSQFTNGPHNLLNCIQMSLKWVGGLDHRNRKAWRWIIPQICFQF